VVPANAEDANVLLSKNVGKFRTYDDLKKLAPGYCKAFCDQRKCCRGTKEKHFGQMPVSLAHLDQKLFQVVTCNCKNHSKHLKFDPRFQREQGEFTEF